MKLNLKLILNLFKAKTIIYIHKYIFTYNNSKYLHNDNFFLWLFDLFNVFLTYIHIYVNKLTLFLFITL